MYQSQQTTKKFNIDHYLATASKSKTSLLLIKIFFLLSLSSTNLFSNGGRWVLTVGNNLWVWWCDWVWCLKVGFANDWVWCMKLKLGLGWISDAVSSKARQQGFGGVADEGPTGQLQSSLQVAGKGLKSVGEEGIQKLFIFRVRKK